LKIKVRLQFKANTSGKEIFQAFFQTNKKKLFESINPAPTIEILQQRNITQKYITEYSAIGK
jgi:hypothetical protein